MGERISLCCIASLFACVVGCIPYTVGTTAQPAPMGEGVPSLVWYSIPNGLEDMRDSGGLAYAGVDAEGRVGVSDRADVGVRIPAMSGLVVSYKYRLTPSPDRTAPALAIMGGTGLVNLGNHAYFDLTLLASGRQATFTPYGGLRASQVVPLSRDAVHDSPTAGGFLGLRIGRETLGVSPEVGVYYDRSALGLRSSAVIVVPALVIHGSELIDLVGRALGGRGGRRRLADELKKGGSMRAMGQDGLGRDGLSRREMVAATAAALAAPLLKAKAATAPAMGNLAPRFLTPAELALLDELTELIIPTDDHSPGAGAAGVAGYIDGRLAESLEPDWQARWRSGLQAVEGLSRELNGKPFLEATPEQRVAVLARMAAGESDPKTSLDHFFNELKRWTARGYYTSKIGIHVDQEYKGNVYQRGEFAGFDAKGGP